jgi:Fe-S cluster assembly protein SufD
MVTLDTNTNSLLAGYDLVKPLLETDGPASFSSLREQGVRKFREFGVPTVRDEEFKYLPLHELNENTFKFGYGQNMTREELNANTLASLDAYTLVFVNGQFAPDISSVDELPNGLVVAPLNDAYDSFSSEINDTFGKIATYTDKLGSTNDDRFVALNSSYISESAFVHVTKNTTIEKPIQLIFITKTEGDAYMVYPRTLVIMEENSEASLIENYLSVGGTSLCIPVTEISLAKSARLEHLKYQNEHLTSIHIANTFVNQERDSVYTSNVINFGASKARHDVNVWVGGENAQTYLNAANVATDHQIIDNHTRIDHAVPNCQSFEVYKSILKDHGTGVFNGKIFVYEDAQKTDAKQTNQALLMSPTAVMNTKPQLEIFADDVKCTHGATIGQMREDALFYLITLNDAKGLLVFAFAGEVLEKISNEAARAELVECLFAKLS